MCFIKDSAHTDMRTTVRKERGLTLGGVGHGAAAQHGDLWQCPQSGFTSQVPVHSSSMGFNVYA